MVFFQTVENALENGTFISMNLGANKGVDVTLKSLTARLIILKEKEMMQCTYRHKTKDIVKNMPKHDLLAFLEQQLSYETFRFAALYTVEEDATLEYINASRIIIKTKPASKVQADKPLHNRTKKRHIEAKGQEYLHALGITNAEGVVKRERQDKLKQIHQYIEIIRPLLLQLPEKTPLKVVDMGAGKGYLTFALYDFLTANLAKQVEMVGVEYREDLVKKCTSIAKSTGFDGLSFVQGTIEGYTVQKTDMLIALHACDTATDDAIAHGIQAEAGLIVVSPCCHKQIRREMETAQKDHALSFVTRHGIFLEREAEMVTDSLRALLLEYYGYKVKVVEFIENAHTPKNVLIIAERNTLVPKPSQQKAMREQIASAKNFFGIQEHYLERLLPPRFDESLDGPLEERLP